MAILPTRTRRRRSAAVGLTAIALAGLSGLTACGGGDDADNSSSGASSSAPASGDSGGTDSAGSTSQASGDRVSPSQMADIVTKAASRMSTAHMTMDMDMSTGGQRQQMTADGDVSMKPLAEHMTMTISGTDLEMIVVDKKLYIKGPGMGTGDTWVTIDSEQLSKLGGGATSDAMTNPLALVQELTGAIESATHDGSESVDGTDADRYTVKVDTKKLMSSVGGDSASAASLPDTMAEDLWIDGQGRLVQSKVDMGPLGTVTVHVSKQGEPVKIQAPPASQVTKMPSAG